MLRNAFFWELDPHPPPRNANNIEPYTFVTLFLENLTTPPNALLNTWMAPLDSSAKYLQCYLHFFSFLIPTRSLKQRPSQNACRGCPFAPMPAWMVVTVLGGATTIIAPVLMASISLDLKVSIEGAHAIFTAPYPNSTRYKRGTDMGHVGLLWTGMSIYDDLSGHGLEAHSRLAGGSSWLADYGLYI